MQRMVLTRTAACITGGVVIQPICDSALLHEGRSPRFTQNTHTQMVTCMHADLQNTLCNKQQAFNEINAALMLACCNTNLGPQLQPCKCTCQVLLIVLRCHQSDSDTAKYLFICIRMPLLATCLVSCARCWLQVFLMHGHCRKLRCRLPIASDKLCFADYHGTPGDPLRQDSSAAAVDIAGPILSAPHALQAQASTPAAPPAPSGGERVCVWIASC